jgi:ABC-type branched-subunit amino acid transport system ATPase component
MARALELRHVMAGYGETVVLEDVDLVLERGDSISVIGRNGVGKSTLLATVMGHTTLHTGEVLLGGQRVDRVPVFRRARSGLGFVPQEREIFPSLTVRENLEVAARPGHWTPARVFELFPNLAARLSNAGDQLSGGEQQMLSIARALLTNPSVLHGRPGAGARGHQALTTVLRATRRARCRSCCRAEQPRGARLLGAHGDGQGRIAATGVGEPAPIPVLARSSAAATLRRREESRIRVARAR